MTGESIAHGAAAIFSSCAIIFVIAVFMMAVNEKVIRWRENKKDAEIIHNATEFRKDFEYAGSLQSTGDHERFRSDQTRRQERTSIVQDSGCRYGRGRW